MRHPKAFETIKNWTISAILAFLLASTPGWADAGLLVGLTEKIAAKVAEHQAGKSGKPNAIVPNTVGQSTAGTGFSGCKQLFPLNQPLDVAKVNSLWRPVALCSNHFAVLNSRMAKAPLVVIEKLSSAMLADARGEQRSDEFYPEPRLARGSRAELNDFAGTGYDRGHLASAASQPNHESMVQSFALSNMVFCYHDLFVFNRT